VRITWLSDRVAGQAEIINTATRVERSRMVRLDELNELDFGVKSGRLTIEGSPIVLFSHVVVHYYCISQ
jgi:hypothetical protein